MSILNGCVGRHGDGAVPGGGCDGLTGAWQWELLSAQACMAKARVTAALSGLTVRPGRS